MNGRDLALIELDRIKLPAWRIEVVRARRDGNASIDPRDRALAELARRYLAGHGPAADRDLAKWAQLPLRDARAGLEAVAPELNLRPDGLVDLRRRPEVPRASPP